MKILLDECVPWPIRRILNGHICSTAQREGWSGLKNGELLRSAEGGFDLFISSDQNIEYQQNLQGRAIAILLLSTNKLRPILAASTLIQSTIAAMKPGEFRTLDIPII
jgi:hypothetical protein